MTYAKYSASGNDLELCPCQAISKKYLHLYDL